jgi:hypothetical protein
MNGKQKTVVEVWKQGSWKWVWACWANHCEAATYEKHGYAVLWEIAYHDADAHARKWHRKHLPHDR